MFVYLSTSHGCAYTLDESTLIMTELHDDLTYDTAIENWVEVDHMALLGEEQGIQNHIQWVENTLLSLQQRD